MESQGHECLVHQSKCLKPFQFAFYLLNQRVEYTYYIISIFVHELIDNTWLAMNAKILYNNSAYTQLFYKYNIYM